MKSNPKPVLKIRAQRPCFTFETENICVTVYTKRKYKMTLADVNFYLDAAKKKVFEDACEADK